MVELRLMIFFAVTDGLVLLGGVSTASYRGEQRNDQPMVLEQHDGQQFCYPFRALIFTGIPSPSVNVLISGMCALRIIFPSGIRCHFATRLNDCFCGAWWIGIPSWPSPRQAVCQRYTWIIKRLGLVSSCLIWSIALVLATVGMGFYAKSNQPKWNSDMVGTCHWLPGIYSCRTRSVARALSSHPANGLFSLQMLRVS